MKSLHNTKIIRPYIKKEDIIHINVLEEFKDYIDIFKKKYLKSDGTINAKAIFINKIFRDYTDFTEKLDRLFGREYIREVMYCILKDIDEIPRCPVCNNYNYLRDFTKGWQVTCCKKCLGEYQSNDESFAEKIKKSVPKYVISYLEDNNYDYYKDNNYIVINNYCHHSPISIYNTTYQKLINHRDGTLCYECNIEIYKNYIPTEEEILSFQKEYESFHEKYNYAYCEKWWMTFFPHKKKIIDTYCSKYIDNIYNIPDNEKYYLFGKNIRHIPTCNCSECNNYTIFRQYKIGYAFYCKEHYNLYHSQSKFESSVKDYIKQLGITIKENINGLFDNNQELDIIIDEKNLAIECNGCYYHTTGPKTKDYHLNKHIQSKKLGYDLLMIWDDIWNRKKDVYKHYINHYLGLNTVMYKTNIRELNYNETINFLDNNSLYDVVYDKSYGIVDGSEIYAVMCITYKKNMIQIVSYNTKLFTDINQGFKLLIDYISKDNISCNMIICTIDNDYCFGQEQENCNMKIVKTDIDYMWFKSGKRYDKSLFSEADSLLKCYNSGTTTYSLIVNNS